MKRDEALDYEVFYVPADKVWVAMVTAPDRERPITFFGCGTEREFAMKDAALALEIFDTDYETLREASLRKS